MSQYFISDKVLMNFSKYFKHNKYQNQLNKLISQKDFSQRKEEGKSENDQIDLMIEDRSEKIKALVESMDPE